MKTIASMIVAAGAVFASTASAEPQYGKFEWPGEDDDGSTYTNTVDICDGTIATFEDKYHRIVIEKVTITEVNDETTNEGIVTKAAGKVKSCTGNPTLCGLSPPGEDYSVCSMKKGDDYFAKSSNTDDCAFFQLVGATRAGDGQCSENPSSGAATAAGYAVAAVASVAAALTALVYAA